MGKRIMIYASNDMLTKIKILQAYLGIDTYHGIIRLAIDRLFDEVVNKVRKEVKRS